MSVSGTGRPPMSTRSALRTGAVVVVLSVAALVSWLLIPGRPGGSPAAGSGSALHGDAVDAVLLDGDQLTALLAQPFKKAHERHGGLAQMEEPASSGECVGVVNVAPRWAYRDADVRGFARQTWTDAAPRATVFDPPAGKVMFVQESVVALPDAAAAQALFAEFTEEWRRCDGQAVADRHEDGRADSAPQLPGTSMHITDVRTTDTVLTASIALDGKPAAPDTRAVGVRGNCIVGVLIAFTGATTAAGTGDPRTSSTVVVRALMDRVDALH